MRLTHLMIGTMAASLALTTTALAAAPDDAIKARKGLMRLYAFNVGLVGDMAKGKSDYDAQVAATAADNLLILSRLDTGALWPPGSHERNSELEEKTRALPAFWEDPEGVRKAGEELGKALKGLSEAAGNGLPSLRQAMKPVGEGCKGCHKEFRAEKKK
ncbi:cytochrome c [Motiliproteus sp. SC1-56]|uniref:c-type cytochrome n=1 Tax=Motiliproteus sp. SC1-56 TaxID=2799565 RepID=UPI001A8F91FF|nr:cytochrome c [Motiliproteus sp. SC1-56]